MRTGWTLEIKNQAWTEDTENQVAFLIQSMGLTGGERILDLACGYGRHALAFARRGFSVVGVDITPAYIEDARRSAGRESLPVEFLLSDVRDLHYANEFDVVLNLADGAIGYFEQDEENLVIFDVIANALKPGGKHFMDVCSADHAQACFPKRGWAAGEQGLSLSEFTWDREKHQMRFTGCELPYGEPARRPVLGTAEPTRLYFLQELKEILAQRGICIRSTYSDYYGKPASQQELQLMVYSQKDS